MNVYNGNFWKYRTIVLYFLKDRCLCKCKLRMLISFYLCIIQILGVVYTKKVIYASLGETVILECEVYSDSIQWSYENNTSTVIFDGNQRNPNIPSNKFDLLRRRSEEAYDLQINNISIADEGLYRCASVNKTGSWYAIKDTTLNIKRAPSHLSILNTDKTINGTENEKMSLSCSSDGGVPKGRIFWFDGRTELAINFSYEEDKIWANYSFIPNRQHNGKTYTCVLEHELLRLPLNESVNLNIFYKPVVQVFSVPTNMIFPGRNVILYCETESNPIPTEIIWRKNGSYVSSGSIHVIQNVTKDYGSNYSCTVTNSLGTENQSISLLVQDAYVTNVPDTDITEGLFSKQHIPILYGVSALAVIISLVAVICNYIKRTKTPFAIETTQETDIRVQEPQNGYHTIDETAFSSPSTDNDHHTLRSEISIGGGNMMQSISTQTENTANASDQTTTENSSNSSDEDDEVANRNDDDYLHPYCGLVHVNPTVHKYEEISETFI